MADQTQTTASPPSFDQAFNDAWSLTKQQPAAVSQAPQYNQAFNDAWNQTLGQARSIPAQILDFPEEFNAGATAEANRMMAGAYGMMGDLFDPDLKYSQQNVSQLLDGIGKQQQRLNDLQAQMDERPDSGFDKITAGVQAAGIEQSIRAMRRNLERLQAGQAAPLTGITAQAPPTTLAQQIGEQFYQEKARRESLARQELGEEPIQAGPLETALAQMETAPPLTRESASAAYGRQLGGNAAYIVPELALSAAGAPFLGAAVGQAGFVGGIRESALQEAQRAGVEPGTAVNYANLAAGFAPASWAITHTILGPFLGGQAGLIVGDVLKKVIWNAGLFAGTVETQNVYNNTVAMLSGMDPNRKWNENMGRATMDNVATMGIFAAVPEVAPFLAGKFMRPVRPGPNGDLELGGSKPGQPTVPGQQTTQPVAGEAALSEMEASMRAGAALPQSPEAAAAPRVTTSAAAQQLPSTPESRGLPASSWAAELGRMAAEWRQSAGDRLRIQAASPTQLPMQFRAALRSLGTEPEDYTTFIDKRDGTVWVNPRTATPEQLNEAIVRNWAKYGFADKTNVKTLDSWSEAADNPNVARLLLRDPNADTTTHELYDRDTGTTYLNVPLHLEAADPVQQLFGTMSHVIGGHQGVTYLGGDDLDGFLLRRYGDLRASGMGDHIWSQFGLTFDSAADKLGLLRDATGELTDTSKRRLADESISRYAEGFNPRQLDQLPSMLQRLTEMVQRNMSRYEGMKLTPSDTFRMIQNGWRFGEPLRLPDAHAANTAKQIIKAHEPHELVSVRGASPHTEELHLNARLASGGPSLPASRGDIRSTEELRAASDKLGTITKPPGYEYDESRLAQLAPLRVRGLPNGAEHELRFPRDSATNQWVVNVTRPESATGPYGVAPSFPARPGPNGQGRALDAGRATPAEYLQRLALSNKYFGSGHELEGYARDPGTNWWRIISSQPRINDFRPATTNEVAGYMADRGFHQIDERTYYNPAERVLVLQADGGSLKVDNATGEIYAHNVAPFQVEGPMARALDGAVSDPSRLAGMENGAAVKQWLDAYSGLDPLTQARLAQQMSSDQAALSELRQKSREGQLTPQEQAQMDAIEYGPLLKRDLDAELGPGSPNEPPLELLKRAIEDQARAMPREEYERVHAARAAQDPNTPSPVQAFNAAPDQLLAEKGSRKFRRAVIDQLMRDNEGDLSQVANNLIGDKYATRADGGYEPIIYGELTREIRSRRAAAVGTGDSGAVAALDAQQMALDDWANKYRTEKAKNLQAWQDVYYSADGLYSNAASQFRQQATKDVRSQPDFQKTADAVRDAVKQTSREIPDDPNIKNATRIAQEYQDRQEGGKRAVDWAESMGRQLVQQALGARMLGPKPPDLSTIYRTLKQTIEGQIRDYGVKLDRETRAKLTGTDTIAGAMRAWPFLRNVQDWVAAEGQRVFANDPEMARQFQELTGKAMEVPFNKAQLGRFAREEGVNIGELLRAHRDQTGKTIESLQDFLTRQSDLTPEQTQAVAKAVNNFITEAVQQRRRAEFDRIIDRANQGKPAQAGRGTTLQRLLDLTHMGAFNDDQVANALAPVYGYKGYDPKLDTELNRIADQLEADRQAGRDGFQTEEVRMKLNRLLANYAQFKFRDYQSGMFQGNVVATIPGHEVGFINEMFLGLDNLVRRLVTQEKLNPITVAGTLKELVRGFGQGFPEAAFIFRTGAETGRFKTIEELRNDKDLKTPYIGSFFESRPTTRFFTERAPLLKGLGQAIDWHMMGWRRAISALHNFIYSGFGRPNLYLTALQWARNNPDIGQDKARAWVNEALNPSRAARAAFEQQADREGLAQKPLAKAMRVNELIEQRLPPEALQAADWAGTKANAFEDPKGLPGMVSGAVGQVAKVLPEIHLVMPIVRLPMNLLNNAIDFGPLGLARYVGWGKGPEGYLTKRGQLTLTPEQLADLKAELLWRGVTYSALLGGLGALAMQKLPNGKFLIPINGAGPADKKQYYQLLDQGWQPHSIQFGNTSIPFEAFPGWLGLEALGNYQDAQRYLDMPSPDQAFAYTLGRTWGAMLDRSTLRGLSDLLDSFKEIAKDPTNPVSQKSLAGLITRIEIGSVPFEGASYVKQIYQQYLDDKLYQANGWGAITRDLPFAFGAGTRPELNVLGEPVQMHPLTHRFWSNTPDDEVWKFLSEHEGLWLPKVEMVKKAQAVKLLGQPLTDEQKYDYTAFRGEHLRQLLYDNLDSLRSAEPDELDDQVKALGKQANKEALSDLVEGKKPQF